MSPVRLGGPRDGPHGPWCWRVGKSARTSGERSQIPNQPYPNPQQPGAYPPGPEALAPEQQRSYGMLAHLAPAIALPLSAGTLGFVASLVVYLMYRDRGDFVR